MFSLLALRNKQTHVMVTRHHSGYSVLLSMTVRATSKTMLEVTVNCNRNNTERSVTADLIILSAVSFYIFRIA